MIEILLKLLIVSYATVGVVSTIGYIPTIKDLWTHKKMSANLNSYIIWTITAGITFLYSLFILNDLLFRIVSGLGFLCCASILVLCLVFKHRK